MPPSLPQKHFETFYPSKKKWAGVSFLGALFVAVGCFMTHDSDLMNVLAGWACIILFGFVTLASLVQLFFRVSFLRLTEEGLVCRSLWRTQSYRWSDICDFGVTVVGVGTPVIGINFSPAYFNPKNVKSRNFMRKFNGYEASLPDNYGWNREKLVAHLNSLRQRFTLPPDLPVLPPELPRR